MSGETRKLTEAEVAAHEAIGVQAYLGVPLVKNRKLNALLGLHDSKPHARTPLEIALAEDAAERTWAAVERARRRSVARERGAFPAVR